MSVCSKRISKLVQLIRNTQEYTGIGTFTRTDLGPVVKNVAVDVCLWFSRNRKYATQRISPNRRLQIDSTVGANISTCCKL